MRYFLRWWETLGRPERIVAMSLVAGSTVTIASSTVWAIAVSYVVHQKTKAALATAQVPAQTATSTSHGRDGRHEAPQALGTHGSTSSVAR